MTPIQAIDHLKQAGMTETAIAAAVGARQSTINRIRNGQQIPNWELGAALITLAISTVGNDPQAVEVDRAA